MAEARDAAKNNDDNWKRIVELLTGYILPQRKTLFDTLKGNEGIPLMHVRLDKVGGSQHMPGFVQSGGWLRDKTDFVLPYYRLGDSGKDDPSEGSNLGHYKAHITFIGRAAGDTPPSGNVAVRGGEKTSKVLKEDGMWNKGDGEKISWDALPLMQYVHGSKAALDKIVLYPHSTQGFESRGISIPDDSYVDLLTFTEVAKSLDRVVKFFQDSAKTLEEWEAKDIGNGSMSWAGTSASLFKQLVHKMAKNYEGYAAQVGNNEGFVPVASADGETIGSAPGRALMNAQFIIQREAVNLSDAWNMWKPMSSPHRFLWDMLMDAQLNMFENQYEKIDFEPNGIDVHVFAKSDFKNTVTIYGKDYGPPNEVETWQAIGEEAVRAWNQSVDDWLSIPAADSIVAITEALSAAQKPFGNKVHDVSKGSLADLLAKEEAKKEKEEAKKEKAEAKKEHAAAKAEAAKEKAEAKKEHAAAKAEAEKEKAEAKKEQQAEKAEAKKEHAAAKAEAEKEKAEAKKEQQAEKAEAKKEHAAAKAEAEKEKAEAKKEQQAEKAEAKKEHAAAKQQADQDRAEARAQNDKDRAEAKAAQDEARSQNEQDRAEAKSSAVAAQAAAVKQAARQRAEDKKAQDEARAQNEQDRAEAKREQEEEKEAAKKEQAAAKAEAEKERAEAKREQEEEKEAAKKEQAAAKAEAEKERAEAKAQNDQDRAEAQKAQDEARAQNEQDRAEVKREQEEEKEAAKKEQAAAKAEAEKERAEAKAQNDQDRAEAQKAQDEARAQNEQDRDQARQDSQQARAEAKAEMDRANAEARADRDAAEQKADQQEAEAKREFERDKAEAQEQRERAQQQADQDRAEARQQLDRDLADGRTSEAEARRDFDRRMAEIDAVEREAIDEADRREAEAKDHFDQQRSDAVHERESAREQAEQARRDAKATYDRSIGDIQADQDRFGAGDKSIEELIRQRMADLPEPDLTPTGAASQFAAQFSDNLYNQDDLADALGRGSAGDPAYGGAGSPSGAGGAPGMYPPMMRGTGGDGGGGSSGERTRTVIEPAVSRGRRPVSSAVEDEEHQVVPRGTQSSGSMPFMGPMGGGGMPGGQDTESKGDRERTSWVAEDEDVWGTDDGGLPQALGR
ncbi:hypothetical protein QFZ82_000434 [Streptomyces sp. V4I23]|uniref:AAWKG family protein n=1 Tax=Streptomyces sp. V4I23 TaxID=3042282 RepID=UPI00277D9BD0|nr:AAWKG family protein [Streptomyces sp. V4I23]MDQ1005949.1 hypothetical protein [Streptomyces sp. V4I23]